MYRCLPIPSPSVSLELKPDFRYFLTYSDFGFNFRDACLQKRHLTDTASPSFHFVGQAPRRIANGRSARAEVGRQSGHIASDTELCAYVLYMICYNQRMHQYPLNTHSIPTRYPHDTHSIPTGKTHDICAITLRDLTLPSLP